MGGVYFFIPPLTIETLKEITLPNNIKLMHELLNVAKRKKSTNFIELLVLHQHTQDVSLA